jgi:putative ATPase
MAVGTGSLFEGDAPRPLADSLRPASLEEVLGQDHLLGAEAPLGRMTREGRLTSMILWGPAGNRENDDCTPIGEPNRFTLRAVISLFFPVSLISGRFSNARRKGALAGRAPCYS